MTPLDWIIVAFTVLMATWGYAQGLIVGALSLGGFAVGAVLGSRLGPLVLEEGSSSPYAPLSALIGAILLGGILASLAEVLGFHLRRRLGDRLGLLDGVGGGVVVRHADEHHQARPWQAPDHCSVDGHARARRPLHHDPHDRDPSRDAYALGSHDR